jgi:hypothetical protein
MNLLLYVAISGITMVCDTPGWWFTYPSEKYAKVSWDHDIPN